MLRGGHGGGGGILAARRLWVGLKGVIDHDRKALACLRDSNLDEVVQVLRASPPREDGSPTMLPPTPGAGIGSPCRRFDEFGSMRRRSGDSARAETSLIKAFVRS